MRKQKELYYEIETKDNKDIDIPIGELIEIFFTLAGNVGVILYLMYSLFGG